LRFLNHLIKKHRYWRESELKMNEQLTAEQLQARFLKHLIDTENPCSVSLFKTNKGANEKDELAKKGDTVVKAIVKVNDSSFDLSKKVGDKYVHMLALMEYMSTDDKFQNLVETQGMKLKDSIENINYTDSSISNYDRDANKPKDLVCLTFSSSYSF
jgi:hypothetical protein|tara:strand:- start:115 stop:585 length:471 start_codon:yes stop_codon:yes gene_type:complete